MIPHFDWTITFGTVTSFLMLAGLILRGFWKLRENDLAHMERTVRGCEARLMEIRNRDLSDIHDRLDCIQQDIRDIRRALAERGF